MTQTEYKQKKRECLEEYVKTYGYVPIIPEKFFNYVFDRAYALGKQEKEEQETLTCEKRKVLYHFRLAEACKTGNNPESDYWIGYSRAIQELFGFKGEPCVEPKPSAPKYHIGQKVKFKDKDFGFEITAIEKWDDCDEYKYKLAGWKHSYRESDLEPYTK